MSGADFFTRDKKTLWIEGIQPIVAHPELHRFPSGMALAPWRLHQVAGRLSGHDPRATLDALFFNILSHKYFIGKSPHFL
jgi:hypothetical protein